MGFFIEAHCDVARQGQDLADPLVHLCWTANGDNPQGRKLSEVIREARRLGWIIKNGRAGLHIVCPGCQQP